MHVPHLTCSCDVQALYQGQLGPSIILGIVVPLLQQAIVGAKGLEGTPHKRKGQADVDKERGKDAALAESAVNCLKSAAAALDWPNYRQLLGRYVCKAGLSGMHTYTCTQ